MKLGTPDFVGERLREAREARGLPGTTLAELLGVSRQAVSQYENNQQTPAPSVMERICSVLLLPREYFVHRSREKLGPLFFRSYASATKTERTKQYQRQKWRRRLVRFIAGYATFPAVRMPALYDGDPRLIGPTDIERFAVQARRAFGLGDGPISDVALLLENHGAIVVRTQFDARTLDAFSEWSPDDDRPYSVLNADKRTAVRSRFDIAHELAHILLHRGCQSPSEPRLFKQLEVQAHRFAGAFLVPAGSFTRIFRSGAPVEDLLGLKRIWRLSVAAIARRACDLDLLSPSQYRRLMTELGRRGWRTREPLDSEIPCEEPRLLRRSVDLLLENRIVHPSDFARLGAGSLRDAESTLGLPHGYLDGPDCGGSQARPNQRASALMTGPRRVIRLSGYLQ